MNGCGAAGKTTFEKMVKEIANAQGDKIEILSTIDYVKDVARSFGWNGEKDIKDRKMLSDLKDLLTQWNDSPHKAVQKRIEQCKNNNVKAVFIDSREPEDIKRFVEEYQALTILVKRSTIKMVYGNHADDCVEDYEYDAVIDNSRGLLELFDEANIFYETFVKGEQTSE